MLKEAESLLESGQLVVICAVNEYQAADFREKLGRRPNLKVFSATRGIDPLRGLSRFYLFVDHAVDVLRAAALYAYSHPFMP